MSRKKFINAKLKSVNELQEILTDHGVFQEISPRISAPDCEIIDLQGKLILPPYVDPHIHLDYVFTARKQGAANGTGTLFEGIQRWSETKSDLTVDEIKARAIIAVKKELAHGVQFIRTHADVTDPSLTSLKAMLELREELKDLVTIQIVSFPQEGMYALSLIHIYVVKMGRTQLQDAVPIRLGQSFEAYAAVIERDIRRIRSLDSELKVLNIGATAVGTAINVNPVYLFHIIRNVNLVCGTDCSQAEDLFDATQNLDGFVHTSAALRVCAVNLSKICNDLRLLSSGPKAGLGEINLPPKQNGSSIMPGKINPVIPEVVSQVAYNVIGNDVTVTMAAEAGQLELNAFEPVIFYKIFESIDTLRGAVETLIDNCILGITANRERCRALVESSAALATALCPALGYKKSAEIAKKCNRTGIPVRQIVLEEGLLPEEELDLSLIHI